MPPSTTECAGRAGAAYNLAGLIVQWKLLYFIARCIAARVSRFRLCLHAQRTAYSSNQGQYYCQELHVHTSTLQDWSAVTLCRLAYALPGHVKCRAENGPSAENLSTKGLQKYNIREWPMSRSTGAKSRTPYVGKPCVGQKYNIWKWPSS